MSRIFLTKPWPWFSRCGTSVAGAGFVEGRLLSGQELHQHFAGARTSAEFLERIERLSGFFAVVVEAAGAVWAAVDRVRSFPLFYSGAGDSLAVSDDAVSLRDALGLAADDEVSRAELLPPAVAHRVHPGVQRRLGLLFLTGISAVIGVFGHKKAIVRSDDGFKPEYKSTLP
jgi:hypothetical protein